MPSTPITTSAEALYRVFIYPSCLLSAPQFRILPSCINTIRRSPPQPYLSRRLISKKYAPTAPQAPLTLSTSTHPLDEAISSSHVHLVDEVGNLQHPEPLTTILLSFDRKQFALRQVGVHEETLVPIGRIVSKAWLREVAQAVWKPKKDVADATKQVELSWAIDSHDLFHRLRRIQEFLREGRRVEVLVAAKKKGRTTTKDEVDVIMKAVRDAIKEVDGASEWKAMEGEAGMEVILYFRPGGEIKKEKKAEGKVDRLERFQKKDEEKARQKDKYEKRQKQKHDRDEQKAKLASIAKI